SLGGCHQFPERAPPRQFSTQVPLEGREVSSALFHDCRQKLSREFAKHASTLCRVRGELTHHSGERRGECQEVLTFTVHHDRSCDNLGRRKHLTMEVYLRSIL